MEFFGMGTGEILLVLIVALIIWGPGRIADIARKLGKTVRSLKKAAFDLTAQITSEAEEKEKSTSGSSTQGDRTLGEQGIKANEQ